MNTAKGWAVAEGDNILIHTVYSHRRGAIVNWLVTRAMQVISNDMTDEQIENRWNACRRSLYGEREQDSVQAIEVLIERIYWIKP